MKCKKLVIESDGTMTGTTVKIDGEKIGLVQSFEFSATLDNPYVHFQMLRTIKDRSGNTKTRKAQVRNEKTMKFENKDVPVTEAIQFEFEPKVKE
jgi:hypothetical protein